MLAAVIPLPSPESTPPVTKIYLVCCFLAIKLKTPVTYTREAFFRALISITWDILLTTVSSFSYFQVTDTKESTVKVTFSGIWALDELSIPTGIALERAFAARFSTYLNYGGENAVEVEINREGLTFREFTAEGQRVSDLIKAAVAEHTTEKVDVRVTARQVIAVVEGKNADQAAWQKVLGDLYQSARKRRYHVASIDDDAHFIAVNLRVDPETNQMLAGEFSDRCRWISDRVRQSLPAGAIIEITAPKVTLMYKGNTRQPRTVMQIPAREDDAP